MDAARNACTLYNLLAPRLLERLPNLLRAGLLPTGLSARPSFVPGPQIKALDADAVEAQPHKGAIEAAEEIRGLLDGSRQVNGKKAGAGSVAALNAAPQVRGAGAGDHWWRCPVWKACPTSSSRCHGCWSLPWPCQVGSVCARGSRQMSERRAVC